MLVVAAEIVSATLIESFVSPGEERYFTNATVEVVLKEGAQLQHYRLQRESMNAFHMATTSAELGRASRYETTAINLGAQLSRHDISVVMDHEGAETSVDDFTWWRESTHRHAFRDRSQSSALHQTQLYKGIPTATLTRGFTARFCSRRRAEDRRVETNQTVLSTKRARYEAAVEIYETSEVCARRGGGPDRS